jgi:hypothetical protein
MLPLDREPRSYELSFLPTINHMIDLYIVCRMGVELAVDDSLRMTHRIEAIG